MNDPLNIGRRESSGGKAAKGIFFMFLSLVKATIQSLILIIWLFVGLVFAANADQSLVWLRDLISSTQVLIFLVIFIYYTIANFKGIKK